MKLTLFPLPQVAELEIKEKQSITAAPDISMLKPSQKEVFDGLTAFLRKPGPGLAVLNGYAGTGKSFIMNKLLQQELWEVAAKMSPLARLNNLPGYNMQAGVDQRSKSIVYAATTNRAVKVAYRMADYKSPQLNYSTIHSLMGLKEQLMPNGDMEFRQDSQNRPDMGAYKIIVVDEISMLDNTLIVGNHYTTGLTEYAEQHNLKIIFVGDESQIPAVKRPECILFDAKKRKQLGIQYFTLTEVVRQAKGNPILTLATTVRNNLGSSRPFMEESNLVGDKGVYRMEYGNSEHDQYFEDLLRMLFTSPNFKENPDFARIVAWRNNTVDAMNQIVRQIIYNREDLERLEIGDKLVTRDPVIEDNKIVIGTNEELEVLKLEKKTDVIEFGQDEVDIEYYLARVQYTDFYGNRSTRYIKVTTEAGREMHDQFCKLLAIEAKQHPKGTTKAYDAWRFYYGVLRRYANVNYAYAGTAHTAQGGTFANVIVMEGDIFGNKKLRERNRIYYTAVSRPTDRLWLV